MLDGLGALVGDTMRGDLATRFAAKVEPDPSGCLLWKASTVGHMGYGNVWANGRVRLAHRVAWEMHNGPIPDGALVLHTCDVPRCVNPDHLYLGDDIQNAQDKKYRGREAQLAGESNGRAIITEEDVPAIRALYATGMRQADVGRRFGISRQAVSRIVRGETWRTVA